MKNRKLKVLALMALVCGSVLSQTVRNESYRPLTDDWEIIKNGEHLEIREPEQSNKVWIRLNDDRSLELVGTPDLIVPGKININNPHTSNGLINSKINGAAWEHYLEMSDQDGHHKFIIGNGGGNFGTSWFPCISGTTTDKAPGLYFVGTQKGNNSNGRGVITFDSRYADNAKVPADKAAFEFVSGYGYRLFHINGDGSVISKGNITSKGLIKAEEILVEDIAAININLAGDLAANKITVTANGNTADFVFEENYNLKGLSEVESFILTNKHLPDIPSAVQMEEQGVNLAEMNKLLLQKVEELTLYAIELEKTNKEEELEREKLEERLIKLEKLLIKTE